MAETEVAMMLYRHVKESVEYYCVHWGSPEHTGRRRKGHCGAKAELLAHMLKIYGIKTRIVEARPSPPGGAILTLFAPFDCHFWLEALADGKWITLDPAPDRGIACVMGDTAPGRHLRHSYRYIKRWGELPYWYRDAYNSKLVAPLRWLTNIQIAFVRLKCRIGG
jgi:transglutaminase-like putative cysteine protease